jgi:hypothetical protein
MGWAGHLSRVEEKRNVYRDLVGIVEENNHLEDLDVYGRTMLKSIIKK